jgi:hypothetical protein
MSTPEQFNNVSKLGKLWLHESERVYADRLVSLSDLETYSKSAVNIAKKYFNISDVDDYYKKKEVSLALLVPLESSSQLLLCYEIEGSRALQGYEMPLTLSLLDL